VSSPVSLARLVTSGATPDVARATAASSTEWMRFAPLIVWSIGFAVAACVAIARLRTARRRWSPAHEAALPLDLRGWIEGLAHRVGLRRAPDVIVREDVESGVCIGLFFPRIAVSARLLEPGRRAMLEHVLLHELGHVRRRDPLQSLAWTLARCAYWFHPLVHMGARRAALVRELACDEIAARESSQGHAAYRRTLVEMARSLVTPSAALSAFSGGQIIARIERLSRPPRATSRLGGIAGALLFVLLCACCIPLGRGATAEPSTLAIDDLQGCLRKRFAVMAEIQRQGGLDKALQSP
jgi:beta-lactamase regulating signal transducer with metallopeptidase domain